MALSASSRRFLLFLVVGGALVGGGVYFTGQYLDPSCDPPVNAGEQVAITIPAGATAGDVGALLEEEQLVCSGGAFRRTVGDRGVDSKIVAGEYDLTVGMDVDELITVLTAPPQQADTFRFTVPEGLTVAQTLSRMAENTPFSVGQYRAVLDARVAAGSNEGDVLQLPEFVPPLDEFSPDVREPFEGLLYPLTYEFVLDTPPQTVLQRMIDELTAVVEAVPPGVVADFEAEGYTVYDALVIASLVEREARVGDERDTIASVVRNRLADGQLLQIDASVLYGQGDPAAGAAAVDTSFSSPYNTYENPGLPPTPISGFRGSLVASAMQPAGVDFLYYVVSPDCDGSHNFASSLAEHNNNVAAYRNAGRCQG